MSITVISHKEDADGICSAAVVKAATAADSVVLVDYPNMMNELEALDESITKAGNAKVERVFICDLGLSKRNEFQFVDVIRRIANAGIKVTYIDHHDLNPDIEKTMVEDIGINLVHSIDECTSVQAYQTFKKKLPLEASFLAAAGALTDYMENKPIASPLVSRFDRQFLMLQSTALSYMISANQHDNEFLIETVNMLSQMKYPSDIQGGFEIAQQYAIKVSEAVTSIYDTMVKKKNMAYAQNDSKLSTSTVVNFILGASGKPLAMVYKYKKDIKSYILSVRGSDDCKIHLGRAINEIATKLGGSGGGHEKASGAVLPEGKLEEFVRMLNKKIN